MASHGTNRKTDAQNTGVGELPCWKGAFRWEKERPRGSAAGPIVLARRQEKYYATIAGEDAPPNARACCHRAVGEERLVRKGHLAYYGIRGKSPREKGRRWKQAPHLRIPGIWAYDPIANFGGHRIKKRSFLAIGINRPIVRRGNLRGAPVGW